MNNALIPVLLATAILCGCNSQDAKDITQDAGKLAESAGRSAVNAGAAGKVNLALSLRKGVDMTGLHIEADSGGNVITVGGHVKTKKEKALVLEIARETRGVEKVIDDLRVEP